MGVTLSEKAAAEVKKIYHRAEPARRDRPARRRPGGRLQRLLV